MLETSVAEPQKLVRITTMARAMLEEARFAPCDVAGCERLKRIHERVITQLSDVISADLYEELLTLSVGFNEDAPSPSELRVAQAELVGWLEGVIAGVVATANIGQLQPQREENSRQDLDDSPAPGLYL